MALGTEGRERLAVDWGNGKLSRVFPGPAEAPSSLMG
jgi:hypothetical protein